MGIDIILVRRTAAGTQRCDEVAASGDRVQQVLAAAWESGDLPMLDRVDPVSDLILTTPEMAQLLDELEKLRHAIPPRQAPLVEAMQRLARQCHEDPSLEVWFQAD